MRDLILLSTIFVFWILLITGMNYVYKDELIINALIEGNSSFVININSSDFNVTSDMEDLEITTKFMTKGWWNMLGRILTFRIPSVEQIPKGLTNFISTINYLLLVIMILLFYRLIRSGAG